MSDNPQAHGQTQNNSKRKTPPGQENNNNNQNNKKQKQNNNNGNNNSNNNNKNNNNNNQNKKNNNQQANLGPAKGYFHYQKSKLTPEQLQRHDQVHTILSSIFGSKIVIPQHVPTQMITIPNPKRQSDEDPEELTLDCSLPKRQLLEFIPHCVRETNSEDAQELALSTSNQQNGDNIVLSHETHLHGYDLDPAINQGFYSMAANPNKAKAMAQQANANNNNNNAGNNNTTQPKKQQKDPFIQQYYNNYVSIMRRNGLKVLHMKHTFNPLILKFFTQKYRCFTRFDFGCLVDTQGWYSVTPEYIASHTAKRSVAAIDNYYQPKNVDQVDTTQTTTTTTTPNDDDILNKINTTKNALISPLRPIIVIDGFCGTGGNVIQFALCKKQFTLQSSTPGSVPQQYERTVHVIAVDTDHTRLLAAQHNARIYGVEKQITFLNTSYFNIIPLLLRHSFDVDIVYLSPPWGGVDYKRHIQKSNFIFNNSTSSSSTNNNNNDNSSNILQNYNYEENIFNYNINLHMPINGTMIYTHTKLLTHNIVYFLPKTINTRQMASLLTLPTVGQQLSQINNNNNNSNNNNNTPIASSNTSASTTTNVDDDDDDAPLEQSSKPPVPQPTTAPPLPPPLIRKCRGECLGNFDQCVDIQKDTFITNLELVALQRGATQVKRPKFISLHVNFDNDKDNIVNNDDGSNIDNHNISNVKPQLHDHACCVEPTLVKEIQKQSSQNNNVTSTSTKTVDSITTLQQRELTWFDTAMFSNHISLLYMRLFMLTYTLYPAAFRNRVACIQALSDTATSAAARRKALATKKNDTNNTNNNTDKTNITSTTTTVENLNENQSQTNDESTIDSLTGSTNTNSDNKDNTQEDLLQTNNNNNNNNNIPNQSRWDFFDLVYQGFDPQYIIEHGKPHVQQKNQNGMTDEIIQNPSQQTTQNIFLDKIKKMLYIMHTPLIELPLQASHIINNDNTEQIEIPPIKPRKISLFLFFAQWFATHFDDPDIQPWQFISTWLTQLYNTTNPHCIQKRCENAKNDFIETSIITTATDTNNNTISEIFRLFPLKAKGKSYDAIYAANNNFCDTPSDTAQRILLFIPQNAPRDYYYPLDVDDISSIQHHVLTFATILFWQYCNMYNPSILLLAATNMITPPQQQTITQTQQTQYKANSKTGLIDENNNILEQLYTIINSKTQYTQVFNIFKRLSYILTSTVLFPYISFGNSLADVTIAEDGHMHAVRRNETDGQVDLSKINNNNNNSNNDINSQPIDIPQCASQHIAYNNLQKATQLIQDKLTNDVITNPLAKIQLQQQMQNTNEFIEFEATCFRTYSKGFNVYFGSLAKPIVQQQNKK